MKPASRPGLCLAFLVLVSSLSMAASDATIMGTALYRERAALPPDAVLEDVSRMDVKAEELGQVRQESPGAPPFEFQILSDPSRIEDRLELYAAAGVLLMEFEYRALDC